MSFTTGLLSATVTRWVAFWLAGRVFAWRGAQMSRSHVSVFDDVAVSFVLIVGAVMLVNDAVRVLRFLGNPRIWTELGYAVGGLVAVAVVLSR